MVMSPCRLARRRRRRRHRRLRRRARRGSSRTIARRTQARGRSWCGPMRRLRRARGRRAARARVARRRSWIAWRPCERERRARRGSLFFFLPSRRNRVASRVRWQPLEREKKSQEERTRFRTSCAPVRIAGRCSSRGVPSRHWRILRRLSGPGRASPATHPQVRDVWCFVLSLELGNDFKCPIRALDDGFPNDSQRVR